MSLQEFKDKMTKAMYGITVQEAIEQEICIECRKPKNWYSEAGKREYYISGLCEHCFDKIMRG